MVMPLIDDTNTLAASGAETERGRGPMKAKATALLLADLDVAIRPSVNIKEPRPERGPRSLVLGFQMLRQLPTIDQSIQILVMPYFLVVRECSATIRMRTTRL